jgi:hypothetical protein
MERATRVLLLGLDAMKPTMVEKLLAEGVLPHFRQLLERGRFTRVRPVIPAQTPTNWDTIATGVAPGTHGVVQWGSHGPGEPVWEYYQQEAFKAGLCRAEYLWETAAQAGKRSVVMNYAGYPPTTDDAVFIEWLYRPTQSYFDLAPSTVYHNCPEPDTTDPIKLVPAEHWMNLPLSSRPPLEAELSVVTTTEGSGPTTYALVWSQDTVYDSVLIASTRDAAHPLAMLAAGQWSGWVRAAFRTADQGEPEGASRFKLLELSPEGERLRLYRTDAFPTDGRYCSDPTVGQRLMAELGPYVHSGMSCGLHYHGWLDWETLDEVMAAEGDWWSCAAQLALAETDAPLLMLYWHNLDSVGHHSVPLVDPTGTDYDPEKTEENWTIVRN